MIYDNVKRIADKKGISIAALEKEANLGNGTIGRWGRSSPTVDSVKKVAAVLGVAVSTLLNDKEVKKE
jgi:transcriptional regulator with XRE-family HTH domain